MNKRDKQKEETIADILRVSKELFHEKGYEKTTISNIAKKCGLSKGALYHHFKSKQDVLKEICHQHYKNLEAKFLPIAEDKAASFYEKIYRIMSFARNSQMNTAAASFSKKESSDSNEIENAALSKLLDSYSEKIYIEILAPILSEGKERGECNFPVSGEVIAIYVYYLDTGTSEQLNRILNGKDWNSAEERIKNVIKGFTYGLSQLINVKQKTIAKIILADKMLQQYLEILENRKKN